MSVATSRSPCPVDHAFAFNRDVRGIGCTYKRLQTGLAKLGLGRIVAMIGGAEQRCSLIELQGDVTLQDDRCAEIGPSDEPDRPASSLFARIDRRLNCGGIFGDAI